MTAKLFLSFAGSNRKKWIPAYAGMTRLLFLSPQVLGEDLPENKFPQFFKTNADPSQNKVSFFLEVMLPEG